VQGDPPEIDETLRLLRKKGDALHPERYPTNELIKIKNGFPSSVWNALYQQRPTPDEGDFFVRDDFRYRWLDPGYRPLCRTFVTVDYAIGKKQRNDYTVMGVFAIDAEDNLYCLELRRGRWKTQEIVDNIVALVERHKPEIYAGERGAIHEAVWPVAQAALDAKRLYVSVDETLVPIQDKETRARPLQGRIQRHKFFFSYDEATRPDVYDQAEKEMLQFPNGTHDDIVDCLAWAGRLALNISLPSTKAPPKPASWKDRLARAARVDPSFMSA
jgi:predicted phage terminase large subunit-like protein